MASKLISSCHIGSSICCLANRVRASLKLCYFSNPTLCRRETKTRFLKEIPHFGSISDMYDVAFIREHTESILRASTKHSKNQGVLDPRVDAFVMLLRNILCQKNGFGLSDGSERLSAITGCSIIISYATYTRWWRARHSWYHPPFSMPTFSSSHPAIDA